MSKTAVYGIVIRCQIKLSMTKCMEGELVTSWVELMTKSIIKKAETACDRCMVIPGRMPTNIHSSEEAV